MDRQPVLFQAPSIFRGLGLRRLGASIGDRREWVSRPGPHGGWTRIPVKAIAHVLNRSTATVRKHARALGLTVVRRARPPEETPRAA